MDTAGTTARPLVLQEPPMTDNRPEQQATTGKPEYVLTVDCPDGPGLVYAVSGFVARNAGNIVESLQFRWQTGGLQIEIPAIASNHRDFERLAASYGVPFHYIPVTPETKAAAEAKLLDLVDSLGIHLVVLARFMQVLSDDLCKQLEG